MADTVDTHKPGSTHNEHTDPVPEKGLGLQAADDETAAYATGDPVTIDKATNRRLFWQINRRILVGMLGVGVDSLLPKTLPARFGPSLTQRSQTYFCQSLDKGTLGFSSIMGIQDDAGLTGNKYNWLGKLLALSHLMVWLNLFRHDPVYWCLGGRVSDQFPPPETSRCQISCWKVGDL